LHQTASSILQILISGTSATLKKIAEATASNSSPDESCQNDASPYTKSSLRDFFTVLALSFHAVFEGLAIGLEEESKDVWLLFAGNFIVTKSFYLEVLCIKSHLQIGFGGATIFRQENAPFSIL
jgi:zinc transporter ZupT